MTELKEADSKQTNVRQKGKICYHIELNAHDNAVSEIHNTWWS